MTTSLSFMATGRSHSRPATTTRPRPTLVLAGLLAVLLAAEPDCGFAGEPAPVSASSCIAPTSSVVTVTP